MHDSVPCSTRRRMQARRLGVGCFDFISGPATRCGAGRLRVRRTLTLILLLSGSAAEAQTVPASCTMAAFGTPRYYQVEYDARHITSADFDEDGELDVVTANFNRLGTPTFSVFPGNGTGGFGAPVNTPYAMGASNGIAATDVNGDGHADVLLGGPDQDGDDTELHVFFGNGSAAFGQPAVTVIAPGWASGFDVADVNGDGHADAVFAFPVEPLGIDFRILRGDGAGGFLPPLTATIENAFDYRAFELADFNQDGRLDVAMNGVAAPGNHGVGVWLGAAGGSFGPLSAFVSLDRTARVTAGDINGDALPDLVIVTQDNSTRDTVMSLLGDGTGQFGAPAAFDPMDVIRSVLLADVTGDGRTDLVLDGGQEASATRSALGVLAGDGQGQFGSLALFPLISWTNAAPLAADFNHDGRVDLVAAGQWPSDGEEATGAVAALLSMCGNVADLSITLADSPDPIVAGRQLTYTMQVANNGPDEAGATALLVIPVPMTFVSVDTTKGVCWGPRSVRERLVRCIIGDVSGAPGDTATVTVVVRLHGSGAQTATAYADTSVSDPNPANDSATTETAVVVAGGRDLTIASAPGGGASLTWSPGDIQGGYVIIRTAGGLVTRIPATGMLAADATSYVDPMPLPGEVNCYRLTAMNADGSALQVWTTVCLAPGTAVPAGALTDFRLSVERSFNTAALRWSAVSGTTSYIVRQYRASGTEEFSFPRTFTMLTQMSLPEPTCYVLIPMNGPIPLAKSTLLCGVPSAGAP